METCDQTDSDLEKMSITSSVDDEPQLQEQMSIEEQDDDDNDDEELIYLDDINEDVTDEESDDDELGHLNEFAVRRRSQLFIRQLPQSRSDSQIRGSVNTNRFSYPGTKNSYDGVKHSMTYHGNIMKKNSIGKSFDDFGATGASGDYGSHADNRDYGNDKSGAGSYGSSNNGQNGSKGYGSSQNFNQEYSSSHNGPNSPMDYGSSHEGQTDTKGYGNDDKLPDDLVESFAVENDDEDSHDDIQNTYGSHHNPNQILNDEDQTEEFDDDDITPAFKDSEAQHPRDFKGCRRISHDELGLQNPHNFLKRPSVKGTYSFYDLQESVVKVTRSNTDYNIKMAHENKAENEENTPGPSGFTLTVNQNTVNKSENFEETEDRGDSGAVPEDHLDSNNVDDENKENKFSRFPRGISGNFENSESPESQIQNPPNSTVSNPEEYDSEDHDDVSMRSATIYDNHSERSERYQIDRSDENIPLEILDEVQGSLEALNSLNGSNLDLFGTTLDIFTGRSKRSESVQRSERAGHSGSVQRSGFSQRSECSEHSGYDQRFDRSECVERSDRSRGRNRTLERTIEASERAESLPRSFRIEPEEQFPESSVDVRKRLENVALKAMANALQSIQQAENLKLGKENGTLRQGVTPSSQDDTPMNEKFFVQQPEEILAKLSNVEENGSQEDVSRFIKDFKKFYSKKVKFL